MLEDRLFRLECDLESQVKNKDQLLDKIDLQEKMQKSYDTDKENLEKLVNSQVHEVQVLKQELLDFERLKSQDKVEIEEKEREIYKLSSRLDMIMNEKTNLVTDKEKFYSDFTGVESKLRKEIENTTRVEKVLIEKSRECEKATDDFNRCSSEKNHYQELCEKLRNEMNNLYESKESGGVKHDRLERMLDSTNKDVEYLKKELKLMEEKRQMEIDEKYKIDLKRKEVEGEIVVKDEIIENLRKDTEQVKQAMKRQENELYSYRNMNEGKEEELSKLRGADGRIGILRDRLKTIEDERDQNISELERMRRDLENAKIKERQFNEKMESLHSVIEEKENVVNRQEAKLKDLIPYEIETQELKNKNNLNLKEVEALSYTIDRLREKIENLNQQNGLYENNTQDQKMKFNEFDKQIWEKNRLVQNLEEELDSLRKQLRESR